MNRAQGPEEHQCHANQDAQSKKRLRFLFLYLRRWRPRHHIFKVFGIGMRLNRPLDGRWRHGRRKFDWLSQPLYEKRGPALSALDLTALGFIRNVSAHSARWTSGEDHGAPLDGLVAKIVHRGSRRIKENPAQKTPQGLDAEPPSPCFMSEAGVKKCFRSHSLLPSVAALWSDSMKMGWEI